MTISENAFTSNPETSAPANGIAAEPGFELPKPQSKTAKRKKKQESTKQKQPRSLRKSANTLQNRLLLTVLPTVLIPLAIASGVAIQSTQNQAKETFLNNLEKGVFLTSEATEEFLENAFESTDLLTANPLVLNSLTAGTQKAQSQGLLNKPIEQIERQFAQTKLLTPNASLNRYLQAVAEDKGVAEIILTERNGFNVAYNSPTSDFVQSDEEWWQIGRDQGQAILKPEFDESANSAVLELVNSIKNPNSGELLGVTKVGVSIDSLNEVLEEIVEAEVFGSEQIQIIDANSGKTLNTISLEQMQLLGEVVGGQPVSATATLWANTLLASPQDPSSVLSALANQAGISNVEVRESAIESDHFVLSFEREGRIFQLFTVSGTNLVTVASVEQQEVAAAGRNLAVRLGVTAIALGLVATGVIVLLARQLSNPLTNLANKAQQVAEGDLSTQANLEGTVETVVLADNFNNLVTQVGKLIGEQEEIAQQQKQEKEVLENGIYKLLDEVGNAIDGDLTVRASLDSMEMSTVADLFNAIIDNLNDIAIQVKHSSVQVGSSLSKDEESIQVLAEQAVEEAAETRAALTSVKQMSTSIRAVSQNANQASKLAQDAYTVTQQGTKAIDATVKSILGLRATVGETATKMKYLEESSRKISQVVSLIEEIALKTNLLAINAGRAGEHGQGFSIFGKQLGALAEQSVTATQEIAQIVSAIQLETQEVAQAMEVGSAQAIDSSRLVQSTKQRLGRVLERSQSINELMQSISEATASQSDTSLAVTQLMEQIAQQSEQRLASSQQIAQSIQATGQVAKSLESAVEQFTVTEEE
ncbi:methyl-accepting chemotaxis sensory transducer [Thalassoporum mexicanum PCC 7367]|uniref:methyl-accepting chemotaxis protein n=1 Tax=Thalassoporum mexicanum TaxID=3457544 RepID=UPI00029FDAAB|nr:methyl-accepting chemotaxis protein [Pseudanabaena sp. PCC 7367]AFY68893.1 methyl-accepting chemotaxis sensory transducer [Pseudanabaena sp. PCC 7367]